MQLGEETGRLEGPPSYGIHSIILPLKHRGGGVSLEDTSMVLVSLGTFLHGACWTYRAFPCIPPPPRLGIFLQSFFFNCPVLTEVVLLCLLRSPGGCGIPYPAAVSSLQIGLHGSDFILIDRDGL